MFLFLWGSAQNGGNVLDRMEPEVAPDQAQGQIFADGFEPVPTVLKHSGIALMPAGDAVAVANPDSATISVLDFTTLDVVEHAVGAGPTSVALFPGGNRMLVTLRDEDALVSLLLPGFEIHARGDAGPEPFGVLVDRSWKIYVSVSGGDRVDVFQGSPTNRVGSIATEPQPRAVALSSDQSTLYVSHFLSGRVSVIDTATLEVVRVISTGADSNLSQAILLDEERGFAWLPQTRSNATNPALLFDTTVFPIVSAVDLELQANDSQARIALDIADQPVNRPSDAAVSDGGILWVVNAGSNDVSAIDLTTGFAVAHIEVGDNPSAIALSPDQSRLFVNNALSGTVSVIDPFGFQVLAEISVTDLPLPSEVLRGKILFHTSAISEMSRDQWISCASCHPDGRSDGRTWFFPDGPRNTPSLVGVGATGPFHWSGDLDELQDVEDTIRRIQAGTGLATGDSGCSPACDQAAPNAGRSADLDALAAFMASLTHTGRSPHLAADGTLTPAAIRGQPLFESAETGCADCHPAPLYTDQARHDVGTGRDSPSENKGTVFDTPSLRFLFATAPYLHDGTAATLSDVLTTGNPDGLHGQTSHLSAAEIDDLAAFLNSIPFETVVNQ